MPNVHYLPTVLESADITPRPKYSFDMTQPDPRGFVLIDACVPLELAVEFMRLLTTHNEDPG